MRIHNLTDKTPPWFKQARAPQVFKYRGVEVQPGQSVEFKDSSIAPIAGRIRQHMISVDSTPAWYNVRKDPPVVEEAPSSEEESS